MARKPRIEYEGAFYHVITRGNQRQKIFKEEIDYEKYLEILFRYKSQYKFFLYSYALMNNHVHLLVETQEILKEIKGHIPYFLTLKNQLSRILYAKDSKGSSC
jgi:putative transposase